MQISINDPDWFCLEAVVECAGIETPLTIIGSYEPGQPRICSAINDVDGQQGIDSRFEIDTVKVYVTESYSQPLELSLIDDELKADGFYDAICEAIEGR